MLLLAVSGGIDSMCLCEKVRRQGGPFAIAHCNFLLRGEESDGDEAFVRAWAQRYGIRCHVRRFETAAYAAAEGISIEMAARTLRYRWFGQLCREEGYEAVAVAHNANDNAETLLLNLLRGTGLKGILGMQERGFLPVKEYGDIPLLRPLLGTSREEITAFMKGEGLSWREDSTNGECQFKRNKLRNQVFPLLAEINPSFIRTLNRDMERFAEELSPSEAKAAVDRSRGISGRWQLDELEWDGREDPRQKEGVSILDADRLPGAPIIGNWESGDWIRPMGAPGRKKLQDWFTDHHFTPEDKHAVPLVRDPKDPSHILAIIGYAVDKAVRVTPGTRRIYRLTLLP